MAIASVVVTPALGHAACLQPAGVACSHGHVLEPHGVGRAVSDVVSDVALAAQVIGLGDAATVVLGGVNLGEYLVVIA